MRLGLNSNLKLLGIQSLCRFAFRYNVKLQIHVLRGNCEWSRIVQREVSLEICPALYNWWRGVDKKFVRNLARNALPDPFRSMSVMGLIFNYLIISVFCLQSFLVVVCLFQSTGPDYCSKCFASIKSLMVLIPKLEDE